MSQDNIKSHKKPLPFFRRYIFRKSTGGWSQIDSLPPPIPVVLGLKTVLGFCTMLERIYFVKLVSTITIPL